MINNKPELMRQIADAMEKDPDGWWREFEYLPPAGWEKVACKNHLWQAIQVNYEVRPRPRTIRIDVEVPEPMREHPKKGDPYWYLSFQHDVLPSIWHGVGVDHLRFNRGIWPTEHEAQQAADAIFGALGRKV